jgi:hypothetical protein
MLGSAVGLLPPTSPGAVVPTAARIRTARAIAMLADLAQIVVFPSFSWGALSPVNDALDLAVGLALTWLLGWHWAFLPSFLSELIPIWDLVPTWTAAVWYVTSGTLPPAGGPPGPPIDITPKAPPALKS